MDPNSEVIVCLGSLGSLYTRSFVRIHIGVNFDGDVLQGCPARLWRAVEELEMSLPKEARI